MRRDREEANLGGRENRAMTTNVDVIKHRLWEPMKTLLDPDINILFLFARHRSL